MQPNPTKSRRSDSHPAAANFFFDIKTCRCEARHNTFYMPFI